MEQRLIDANAFEEEARNRLDMQDLYLPIHIKEFVIDDMPTIDAVPVIRCKDCMDWSAEIEQTAVPEIHRCKWWRVGTYPTDFCSRAKRRGEE